MNPWSMRRKTFIFLIVFVALIIVVGIPVYFSLTAKPDCGNGKQDGDETGVDCGGSCQLLCKPEVLPLITAGDARILKVASSTYEAVILVQNPNTSGRVVRAPYTFTIYSGVNADPVKTIHGTTFIAPKSTFALFAGPVDISAPGVLRATFEWGGLDWEKTSIQTPIISVSNMNLITASTSLPRLEATLTNKSLIDTANIEVIALLSDSAGNIVAAGKTFVDALGANDTVPVAFSWPAAFAVEPVTVKILPHILPDKSYLR